MPFTARRCRNQRLGCKKLSQKPWQHLSRQTDNYLSTRAGNFSVLHYDYFHLKCRTREPVKYLVCQKDAMNQFYNSFKLFYLLLLKTSPRFTFTQSQAAWKRLICAHVVPVLGLCKICKRSFSLISQQDAFHPSARHSTQRQAEPSLTGLSSATNTQHSLSLVSS